MPEHFPADNRALVQLGCMWESGLNFVLDCCADMVMLHAIDNAMDSSGPIKSSRTFLEHVRNHQFDQPLADTYYWI